MFWGTSGTAWPAGRGRICPALLCTEAASPRALGAFLGATVIESYKVIRECPEEAYEDVKRSREETRKWLKALGLFSLEETSWSTTSS